MGIRYLILTLTTKCNMHCQYCYNGDLSVKLDMGESVMAQAFSFVTDNGQPFHLQLTGGEPTLVPSLLEKAVAMAQRTGQCSSIGIQTNGTSFTPKLLDVFKNFEIQVGISLDGPPTLQEQIRGHAAETFRGLQQLEAASIAFRATAVLTQLNVSRLDQTVLALAGFSQFKGIGLDIVIHKGRAKNAVENLTPDRVSLRKGISRMLQALHIVNAKRTEPIRFRERDLIMAKRKNPSFCHAGLGESMAVHPNGRIFPCGQTFANAKFSMGTVWQPLCGSSTALGNFRLKTKRCRQCPLHQRCPGECPSRLYHNEARHQDLICEVYQAIWEVETQKGKDFNE